MAQTWEMLRLGIHPGKLRGLKNLFLLKPYDIKLTLIRRLEKSGFVAPKK